MKCEYLHHVTQFFYDQLWTKLNRGNKVTPTYIHASQNVKNSRVIPNVKCIHPTIYKKGPRNPNTKSHQSWRR